MLVIHHHNDVLSTNDLLLHYLSSVQLSFFANRANLPLLYVYFKLLMTWYDNKINKLTTYILMMIR